MEESKFIFASTSKMFVERNYMRIPSFKPVKRTRLFNEDLYPVEGSQLYKDFSRLFGDTIVPIDRTSIIKTPFNTKLHPALLLPRDYDSSKTFEECCDERADSVLRSGKYINVMYGGGIDSVAMMTSLMKNSNRKEQVNVLLTNNSIVRNQKFYEQHICGKYNTVSAYDFDAYLGRSNSIFLTGDCGDEIFGTTFIQNLMNRAEVMQDEPTFSKISSILMRNYIIETDEDRRLHRQLIEMLFRVAEVCPTELDTVYKFFWWLNFVLNWNVSYTRLMSYGYGNVEPEKNYIPFFASHDFQMWSINNTSNLSYTKEAAKQYIHQYHKEPLTTTVKTTNISDICFNKRQVVAIDETMTHHYDVLSSIFLKENSFV